MHKVKRKTILSGIIRIIFIYLLFYFLQNAIFSIIYFNEIPSAAFTHCYYYALLGNIYELSNKATVGTISIFQGLSLTIGGAVMTGCIFQQIINKRPKIILPEKLVIRLRTSANVKKCLSLGVMVGNYNKDWIYDIKCTITCFFVNKDPIETDKSSIADMNGEYTCTKETMIIQNYYRFSFDLDKLPHKFLEDYLSKRTVAINRDYILVTLSGNIDYMGGMRLFYKTKKYRIRDIVIGKDPERFKVIANNPLTGHKKEKILWDQIMNPAEISETERQKIVAEIERMLNVQQSVPSI